MRAHSVNRAYQLRQLACTLLRALAPIWLPVAFLAWVAAHLARAATASLVRAIARLLVQPHSRAANAWPAQAVQRGHIESLGPDRRRLTLGDGMAPSSSPRTAADASADLPLGSPHTILETLRSSGTRRPLDRASFQALLSHMGRERWRLGEVTAVLETLGFDWVRQDVVFEDAEPQRTCRRILFERPTTPSCRLGWLVASWSHRVSAAFAPDDGLTYCRLDCNRIRYF